MKMGRTSHKRNANQTTQTAHVFPIRELLSQDLVVLPPGRYVLGRYVDRQAPSPLLMGEQNYTGLEGHLVIQDKNTNAITFDPAISGLP